MEESFPRKELGDLEIVVQDFEFVPPQNEVEKLLNELERNEQILLLRSLGVREITIEAVISSSSSNTKTSFSSFLKEWNFFQTKEQTISCIRRICQSDKNRQEIPQKFFNELTMKRFIKMLKFNLSKLEIEQFCKHFEIEADPNDDFSAFLDYLEKQKHLESFHKIRKFDSELSVLNDKKFDNLRCLIAEALSIYTGVKSYVTFISTKPESKSNAELMAVFHKYVVRNIPSEITLIEDEKNDERIITSIMKWPALNLDNNCCGWEKNLKKFKDFGVEIKIDIDLPNHHVPDPHQRKIEITSKNCTLIKLASKCSEWYFEKDKEKQNLMWEKLGSIVSNFITERPLKTVSKIIDEWAASELTKVDQKTIWDILDLDQETRETHGNDPLVASLYFRFLNNNWNVLTFIDVLEARLTERHKDYDFSTMQFLLDASRRFAFGELVL